MNSEYINKMQKTAALLNKMLIVINSCIFIAMSVLLMIITSHCISAYHGNFQAMSNYITIDNMSLPQDKQLFLAEKLFPAYMVILLFIFIVILSVFMSIIILRDTLRSVTESRPFDGTVSKNLAKLGKIILGIGILSPVAEFIIEAVISIAYRSVLSAVNPQHASVNILSKGISVNFIVIFTGILIILLGYIFRYGEELQQLSDETL